MFWTKEAGKENIHQTKKVMEKKVKVKTMWRAYLMKEKKLIIEA